MDTKYQPITDPVLALAANQYLELTQQIETLEEAKAKLREYLIAGLGAPATARTETALVTITDSSRRTTDWKKLAKDLGLSDADLAQYTKVTPSTTLKVEPVKDSRFAAEIGSTITDQVAKALAADHN